MDLSLQKRLAAKVSKRSPKKVHLDVNRLADIKEAITKADVKALIADGAITLSNDKGISRYHAKQRASQQRKNKQRGFGHRKGKATARVDSKRTWIIKIRGQRTLIRSLKDRLDRKVFRNLMLKAKGGYFRSLRHIKLYLDEHKLVKQNGNQ